MRNIIHFFILLFLPCAVMSQGTYTPLKVGDEVPDLALKIMSGYPDSSFHLSQFRGKLIILDFWTMYCGTCIKSLPEMEQLQRQFSDDLKVILVNNNESRDHVEKFYERKGWKLPGLTAVYSCHGLNDLFPHTTLPHHVWIDKRGRVMAQTSVKYATPENVERVLNEGWVDMHMKKPGRAIDTKAPLLNAADRLAGTKPLYYSTITARLGTPKAGKSRSGGNRVIYNQTIKGLYMEAFDIPHKTGNTRVIYDLADSVKEVFTGPERENTIESLNNYYQWQQDNTYCYSLYFDESILPSQWIKHFDYRAVMQQDLNVFFGMILGAVASMEYRMVKCLVLEKLNENDTNKLESTTDNDDQLEIDNKPVSMLAGILEGELNQYNMPVVDGAGMKGKYTWILHGDLSQLNNVQNELRRYGLGLREDFSVVKMLVFKQKRSK